MRIYLGSKVTGDIRVGGSKVQPVSRSDRRGAPIGHRMINASAVLRVAAYSSPSQLRARSS
eukprot:3316566-Prymnesium_polylepis.2